VNKIRVLGERICKDDFRRRLTLFKYLVESIMFYEVEIWGRKKGVEKKIWIDYVRWIFKLDFCTPRYLIIRELKLKKLKGGGIRALKFEEKIRGKEENNLLKICWKSE